MSFEMLFLPQLMQGYFSAYLSQKTQLKEWKIILLFPACMQEK